MKMNFFSPWWVSLLGLFLSAFLFSQTISDNVGGLSSAGRMLPEGFISRQVFVPSFDEKGRKTSELLAETLVKLDDSRLQAGRTIILVFAEEAAQNVRVEMPSALYHLEDRLLRCGERCTVARQDMRTEGDSLVFDTQTSMGSLVGRVRTLIFDMSPDSRDSTKRKPSPARQ
jgi:lipopolysaccharide export system protein LptC